MFRNSVISLAGHIIICVLTIILFDNIIVNTSTIKQMIFVCWVLSLLTTLVYLTLGYNLKDINEKIANLVSVSSTSIILILTYVYEINKEFLSSNSYYYMLVFSFYPLIYVLENNKFITLIVAFFPSLFMWLGLEYKSCRIRKKELQVKA